MALILVVDDNPDACDLLSRLLGRMGHEVECAYSGPEALQVLDSTHPDLVLLDYMMPGMSGIDVLRVIRADRHQAATPVVLFTARCDEETRALAHSAGATDFWQKPINTSNLEPALKQLLSPST